MKGASARGLLAAGAVGLGSLMVFGGVGHTSVIVGAAFKSHRPYDFRFAMLVTNGAILTASGLCNVGLARWIERGRVWALLWSTAATLALILYCALLLPLQTAREAAGPAIVLNVAYLAALAVAWRHVVHQRRSATDDALTSST